MYIILLIQFHYTIYFNSNIFALLTQLVEKNKQKPDFLYNIPDIKRGRIIVTDLGRQVLLLK